MFIYEPLTNKASQILLDQAKEHFGIVPPHWELFAKLNPIRFELFIKEIGYLLNHPHINPDFFAMSRLYVANREDFGYCKSFNTKLLLSRGYTKGELADIKSDFTLALDPKHQALADGMKKAIYNPNDFTKDSIESLKEIGWSDEDILDAIDHGAFLFKFSKILKAYLV
jgi:hypothetical protein